MLLFDDQQVDPWSKSLQGKFFSLSSQCFLYADFSMHMDDLQNRGRGLLTPDFQ